MVPPRSPPPRDRRFRVFLNRHRRANDAAYSGLTLREDNLREAFVLSLCDEMMVLSRHADAVDAEDLHAFDNAHLGRLSRLRTCDTRRRTCAASRQFGGAIK